MDNYVSKRGSMLTVLVMTGSVVVEIFTTYYVHLCIMYLFLYYVYTFFYKKFLIRKFRKSKL